MGLNFHRAVEEGKKNKFIYRAKIHLGGEEVAGQNKLFDFKANLYFQKY